MPHTMGMGRAAMEYKKILENMGYNVQCMNWFNVLGGSLKLVQADILVAYVVPQPHLMNILRQIVKNYTKTYGITLWETNEPPECFVEYTKLFDCMFAGSMYTAKMFNPPLIFLPHHVKRNTYRIQSVTSGLKRALTTPGYKFYSISDFCDSRKNYKQLVKGFLDTSMPGAKLVIKHNRQHPEMIEHPNIINIIGELSQSDMEFIHDICNCYVSLSFSEGVGLGIVEAAIRNKPIIMTDYGGQNDYVKTEWKVKTTQGKVGFDEFLFTKDMTWGIPDQDHYKELLKDVYLKSPKSISYPHTTQLVSTKFIKNVLKKNGI